MENKIKFVDENGFDYKQYKKDMDDLKEITNRIIKNNLIHISLNNLDSTCKIGDESNEIKYFGEDGKPVMMDREFHEKFIKERLKKRKRTQFFKTN